MLDEFRDCFYDLVLRKNLSIQIKSVECYLELSNNGKDITFMAFIAQNKTHFHELVTEGLEYFKTNNLVIDSKNKQIIVARRFDFSQMTPATLALKIVQFHSELLKVRKEIENLEQIGIADDDTVKCSI